MKQLEQYIQKALNQSLTEDVAPVVKEIESDQVKEEVYGKYSPSIYKRREDDGGLSDVDNMSHLLEKDGVLSITNETPVNPGYKTKNTGLVTPIVVSGQGYEYPFEYNGKGRDFIQATRDELERNGAHIDALKNGLKKRGLSVK